MDLTPVRKYEHEAEDEDKINVLVPKFTDWFFGKLLQPRIKDKYIKAKMDDFGSKAWLLIDGERSVFEISNLLLEEFGEDIQPVYDRVGLFFTNLYRNGFIYFNEIIEGKKHGKSIS